MRIKSPCNARRGSEEGLAVRTWEISTALSLAMPWYLNAFCEVRLYFSEENWMRPLSLFTRKELCVRITIQREKAVECVWKQGWGPSIAIVMLASCMVCWLWLEPDSACCSLLVEQACVRHTPRNRAQKLQSRVRALLRGEVVQARARTLERVSIQSMSALTVPDIVRFS